MNAARDDEQAIEELRMLMRANGLINDLPAELIPDSASAQRVLERAVAGAPRRHRPTRLIAAAAAAGIIAGGVATWTVLAGAQPAAASPPALQYSAAASADLRATSAAADALTDAAHRAAVSARPGDGDVQFVAVTGWLFAVDADTGTEELTPTETKTWLFPDGSAQVEQQHGASLGRDGRLTLEASTGSDPTKSVDVVPAGTFDPGLIQRLPRAVEPLRVELLKLTAGMQCRSATERAWCLADQIQQLYVTYVIPSDLAAALWDVLAEETAVRDLGEALDRLGRPVRAVAVDAPSSVPSRQVLTLLTSPVTGRLVGTETTTIRDDALEISTPTVTGFQTWLDARLVEGTP